MLLINSFRQTVELTAGLNRLSDIINANIPAGATFDGSVVREVTHRVEAGGPVAKGGASMASIADGASYDVKEGDTERGVGVSIIDIGQIYFFATNTGDRLYLQVSAS